MEHTYRVVQMSRTQAGTAAICEVLTKTAPDGSTYYDLASGDPADGPAMNDSSGALALVGVPDSCRPGDLVHVTVLVEVVDS